MSSVSSLRLRSKNQNFAITHLVFFWYSLSQTAQIQTPLQIRIRRMPPLARLILNRLDLLAADSADHFDLSTFLNSVCCFTKSAMSHKQLQSNSRLGAGKKQYLRQCAHHFTQPRNIPEAELAFQTFVTLAPNDCSSKMQCAYLLIASPSAGTTAPPSQDRESLESPEPDSADPSKYRRGAAG